jgi:hypothetical protein
MAFQTRCPWKSKHLLVSPNFLVDQAVFASPSNNMVDFKSKLYEEMDALRRIQQMTFKTAEHLKSLTVQYAPLATVTSKLEIPPLVLSFPSYIIGPIMKLEISDKIRSELLHCFTLRINELRQKCLANYQAACVSSGPWLIQSNSIMQKLQSAYANFYDRQCRSFLDFGISYTLEEISKRQLHHTSVREKKPTFNHVCFVAIYNL